MTAASNPAAELTEAEREQLALAMCAPDPDREPVTEIQLMYLNAAVERILAARLAGAATDEGLRARLLEWIDDQRQILPEHRTPSAHGKAELLRDLRTYLDAAPAPTEDASEWLTDSDRASIERRLAGRPQTVTVQGRPPAVSRAADTAAEEPRTEAQIKAEALREASQKVDAYRNGATGRRPANTDLFALMLLSFAEDIEYQADRADRLSRADEEAGS